jgi:hypothetical protein
MHSDATTVDEYLAALPDDRRTALTVVRKVIKRHLPKGIVESMNWGMIAYEVPLTTYPDTYNGQPLLYAALASQKNYMAVYLQAVYGSEKLRERFEDAYRASGKKLDMGKSCVRFRTLDALPLDVVADAIGSCTVEQYISGFEAAMVQAKAARAKKKA